MQFLARETNCYLINGQGQLVCLPPNLQLVKIFHAKSGRPLGNLGSGPLRLIAKLMLNAKR